MATTDITRIAGNIQALNALNSLNKINKDLAAHQARLASGQRILEAADDPAGMSLATTFDVRRQGMKTALNAIGDAKNLLSTQEGGLSKVNDILVKMRNKALESTGDTIGADEKAAIYDQMKAFRDEINDIVADTEWNGTSLLGGSGAMSLNLDFLVDADGGTATFGFQEAVGGISTNQSFHSDAAGAAASSITGSDTTNSNIVTGFTKVAADADASELSNGTFSVVLTDNGGGGSDTFHLEDANGNRIAIDDGSGNYTTGEVTIAADGAYDTGRGVAITFDVDGGGSATYGTNTVTYSSASNNDLGLSDTSLDVSSDAAGALSAIDHAQTVVKQAISQVGAFSARMTFKEESLTVAHANTEAAYNRIMNANMAEEQVEASKLQILQQTSTAMLSQANVAPQFVLSLFR